jgi:hypothetical protein
MSPWHVLILVALGLAIASPSWAQRWAIEPYLGAYLADDGTFDDEVPDPEGFPPFSSDVEIGPGPFFGLRTVLRLSPAWSVEGTYGYAAYESHMTVAFSTVQEPETIIRETFDFAEHDDHVYYGVARLALLPGRRVDPFLVIGAGGIRTTMQLAFLGAFPEDAIAVNDFLLVAGGGLSWGIGSRARIRSNLRDLVRFCSQGEGCVRDEALHNLEISGGVEVRL